MEEETIEVAPSEESGNVPAEEVTEVTPSETTETETPTETGMVETTEPELYELPDGRKVTGDEVAQEYKNLLSDYTRKSQELAAKKEPETITIPQTSKYADPAYVPGSYEELLQAAEERALQRIEAKEQERLEGQKAVEEAVIGQLTEIKASDPTLNENALFQHATKYGFRDLKQAHQNMKDMREMAKAVQKTTTENITKRNDPVSVTPGATGAKPDPNQFATARDYLKALKGST